MTQCLYINKACCVIIAQHAFVVSTPVIELPRDGLLDKNQHIVHIDNFSKHLWSRILLKTKGT